jgi:nitrate reductase NapE component
MKYKGPAKPIPTYREPMSDRAELIWFVVLAVIFVLFLILEVV